MTNVDHKLSLGFYVRACFFKLQYEFSLFVMGKCVPRTSYINVTHKEAKGKEKGVEGRNWDSRCKKIRNFWPCLWPLSPDENCVSSGGKSCYLAW